MLKNVAGVNYRLNLTVYVSQLAKRILYFSPASCKWPDPKNHDLGILFIRTSRYIPFCFFRIPFNSFLEGEDYSVERRLEMGLPLEYCPLPLIILALLFCTYDSQVNGTWKDFHFGKNVYGIKGILVGFVFLNDVNEAGVCRRK